MSSQGPHTARVSPYASFPRRALVRLAKSSLRAGARDRPIPVPLLLRLRRFGGRPNILSFRVPVRTGQSLANPFLAQRLGGREFGRWTISAEALNVLEAEIRRRPPARILEFGSGLSTACLSRYMVENAPGEDGLVVSVEEDVGFCADTRAVLAELGLEQAASVHHMPLSRQRVGGREVNCYELGPTLRADLTERPPELVFIDGPGTAGGPYARWAVLLLVLALVPTRFHFYLDDALSDGGLDDARLWSELPRVEVQGIALVGHGLLMGEVTPSRVRPA